MLMVDLDTCRKFKTQRLNKIINMQNVKTEIPLQKLSLELPML